MPTGSSGPPVKAFSEEGAREQAGPNFADVLCAIDGGPGSLDAVSQAAALTAAGGHATVLTVTSFRSAGDRGSPAIGPAVVKEVTDRALAILQRAGIESSVEVDPAGPPARIVLDWARDRDLLAIGPPATSLLGGLFAAGVGDAALGSFATPLLLSRRPADGSEFTARIMIASDGSSASDGLVEMAGGLALAHGARVVLAHATAHEHEGSAERVERQGQRLQELLGGSSELRIGTGSPRTVLLELAQELEVTLMLMSSRRLRGLRAIGSVSRHVAHEGRCSVLLLPPERLVLGRRPG